ncbi:MAG: site-specific DNA-methyltransferase [Melioribacteraceae bacterium]|nr:site-specific DNA-methyltransferase [Melioribacteraceae bacterium]MCF8413051.1 site-specific DNA-methyltransferase [Melioribacteraceae bacterium]MCF8432567.1 site-specific DNA-methyltransferase [Melioribacteraceae bacterium]
MVSSRNRTISLSNEERELFVTKLLTLDKNVSISEITNKTINQDLFEVFDFLPEKTVDLLFIDPPYNKYKNFNSRVFKKLSHSDYSDYLESFLPQLIKILKPTASIYVCCDWLSSASVVTVLEKYFLVRNRITWERDKGRGSLSNWKNNSEDIWYCTMSEDFVFNVEDVKIKRKVLAPYKENGAPKDWDEESDGLFRLTYPSNIWNDISIPFWSMPENTPHPTQKPEKLLAKIILASTNENDLVFDPFLGSGTTSVVSKKLKRQYIGVEVDQEFSLLAEKRLHLVDEDISIQGYEDGVFWERNSIVKRKKKTNS